MKCTQIPSSDAKEAIERTEQTGNEHGFVRCSDGSISEIVEGDGDSLVIDADDCEPPVTIFHTHPNGVMKLSDQDRKVLSKEGVEAVCVGVDANGKRKYMCERSQPSCEVQLNMAEEPDCPFGESHEVEQVAESAHQALDGARFR